MFPPPCIRLAALAALLAVSDARPADPPAEPAHPPRLRATLVGHRDVPKCLAFSPDSKTLASAGYGDGTARLWSVRNFKTAHILEAPVSTGPLAGREHIWTVTFSPDGKTVAMNSTGGTIQLWNAGTGAKVDTLHCHAFVNVLLFSPDGKTLATNFDVGRFWDLAKMTPRHTALRINAPPQWSVMTYDRKGRLLLAIRELPGALSFSVWDVGKGKRLYTCKGHTKLVWEYAFSRDGKRIASASEDHTVRLWDVATGRNTATFKAPPGRVTALAFSPDGRVLAAAFRHPDVNWRSPGDIRFYDSATGKPLATVKGHEHCVECLAFSPDGKWLASGGYDRKIKVWSLPRNWEGLK